MSAATQTTDESSPVSPLQILLKEWRDRTRSIRVRINDRLQFEIHDEGSFRLLTELLQRLENIDAIQAGLDDIEAGRVVTLDEFKQRLQAKNGIPS